MLKSKPKPILAADLFCGAGGTSTGLLRAAAFLGRRVELTAVNHWDRAIETHSANHPGANHHCQSLADLDPKRAVPGGKLDLLVASPECIHHSVARGGKPVNDQSRASAYCVHRWCAALDVKRVLIENVPEFATWGPLGKDNRPLPSGKGKLFAAYLETFRAMGYRVEWRVLNAADFGAATTRRRLFIQAAKGRLPIHWPAATHEPNPKQGLFGVLEKWRAAREIIDWNLPGESIFTRKRPLSENTLKRIEAGLRKFGGAAAEPFLLLLRGTEGAQIQNSARSAGEPVPALTTSGGHVALCEPFLTTLNFTKSRDHDDRYSRSPDEPLPTVTSQGNRFGIVAPFVMRASNSGDHNCRVRSPEEPLGTVHAGGGSFGLVEPMLVSAGGPNVDARPVSQPANTVLTRDHMALVEPFIVGRGHPNANGPYVYDAANPLPTVTTCNEHGVVQPFVMHTTHRGGDRVHSTQTALPTITGANRGEQALVQPLAGARLDIRFRMLQPHELAAAMGFPKDYRITGNRGEQVRQIGNAVVVEQAEALCRAIFGEAA